MELLLKQKRQFNNRCGKKISEGLARVTLAGLVNGEVQDLRHKLTEDCKLEILTFDSLEGKKHIGIQHPT